MENGTASVMAGTWAWGTGTNGSRGVYGKSYPVSQLKDTFETAYGLGYTMWDTAEVYGNGSSESLLKECMEGKEDSFISTKHSPKKVYEQGEVRTSLLHSMERLGVSQVDLYWLHSPKNIKQNMNEMAECVEEGLVRYVGISNCNIEQLKEAVEVLASHQIPLYGVQNHYSLLSMDRQKEVLAYCKANQIRFFGYMLLEQGALSGKYDSKHGFPFLSWRRFLFSNRKFKKIRDLLDYEKCLAQRYQVEVAQIPILWARQKGITPIVGLTKPSHVKGLEQGKGIVLKKEECRKLEEYARKSGVTCKGTWE